MNNLKGTDSVAIATGPSACMLPCFYSTEMNRIVVNDHKAESVHGSIFSRKSSLSSNETFANAI